jgi:hypothetical protein
MSETKPSCPLPIAESEQGLTILKGLLKDRVLVDGFVADAPACGANIPDHPA